MSETARLDLPLVAAAQAQKHVTVNEALSRIDAAIQITVESRLETTPPILADEGESYLVANGAVNAWEDRDGQIASFIGGGWIFLAPMTGWQVFVTDESKRITFDGSFWIDDLLAVSPGRAAMGAEVIERDIVLTAGGLVETGFMIAPNTSVFAVTGRVLETITGTVSSWSLGVVGSASRYGSSLGLAKDSYILGLSGQPLAYYAATRLQLQADGGDFAGGTVRLAVHLLRFEPPDAV